MSYDLAALVKQRKNPRRKAIELRAITESKASATDLFQQCYRPVVDIWTGAAPRIIAAYERTLNEMQTDTASDIAGEIAAAEAEVSRVALLLTARLDSWAVRVERAVRGKWRGAVLSATGVDIGVLIGPMDNRQTLDATIRWNVSLIKDVSAQAQTRISAAVYDGLRNVTPSRDVAKQIRKAVTMSRARSIRIAAHQNQQLTAALADERRTEAGISAFVWHHSGKRFPREEHLARNGLIYSESAAQVGKVYNEADYRLSDAGAGIKVRKPPEDRPGQLPFCGCKSRGLLVFDD